MGFGHMTVYDLLQRGAELSSESLAAIDGERQLRYGELKGLVDSLAMGLKANGAAPGERIGIIAQNSLDFFALLFASSLVGAVIVPINARLSVQEIRVILEDADPALILADENFLGDALQAISGLKGVRGMFSFGKAGRGFQGFDKLLLRPTAVETGGNDPDKGLVIIYTAAVTGRPKGAVLTDSNFVASGLHQMISLGLGPEDVNLNLLPLYHVGGLASSLAIAHCGGVNVFLPKFDPEDALRWIDRAKISTFTVFPPMLSSLLDCQEKLSCNIGSLRSISGLDRPETVRRLKAQSAARFYTGYGQTETTGLVTCGLFDERPGSAGKVSPLARLRLVDEFDRDVPRGSPGEIVVRGPLVFKGYWKLEKETAYVFRGGWHHTGDVARFDPDNYLWYVKRRAEKELIKPGGENVYPSEVEQVILQLQGIEEATVIGIPHPKWGEGIKAICVVRDGFSITEEELVRFVAGRIARFKKPHVVQFVPSLPKDEAGFIDREKVKALYGGVDKNAGEEEGNA